MALTRAKLANPNCEVTDSDYDAIEAAIMESSRGRWFLAEYARRNRHADTNLLLSEINEIKETLAGFKNTSRPYLVSTIFSTGGHANQTEKNSTPLRLLQTVPNVADSCGNDKPSIQRGPDSLSDEKNIFEFKY